MTAGFNNERIYAIRKMLFVNRNTGPLKFRQRLKKILWIPKELFKDKYNIYPLIYGQVFTNWAMNTPKSSCLWYMNVLYRKKLSTRHFIYFRSCKYTWLIITKSLMPSFSFKKQLDLWKSTFTFVIYLIVVFCQLNEI